MRKIEKVLFFNPPDPMLFKVKDCGGYNYFEPPLGLLYVYDFMKKRGDIDVNFVDLNIEMKFRSKKSMEEIIKQHLESFSPDMVAVATLYYVGMSVFLEVARLVKQFDSTIKVIFGGHYPHHLTAECLSDENIDYAVLSEGELGLSDLISALNNGEPIDTLEGIAFRKNGEIVKNPRKNFWDGFSDINRLPWEDTHFEYYFKEGRNMLHRVRTKDELRIAAITATRGCPNKCTFCTSPAFWKGRWRKRKISNVIDEIKFLKSNYGVNTIVFNDENISIHKEWFIEFLDELTKLNIFWMSSGGFSLRTINDETIIKKICDSGIALFNLAFESASNETLKMLKKPLTVEESVNTLELIRKYSNVFINGFFVIGFPFEKLEDIEKTLKFAESLDIDWRSHYCFQPFPGSELFDYCIEHKLIKDFNVNYGDIYFAPEFTHIDYTSEELDRINYLANLKNNFLNNRNVRLNTHDSLAQAERDFKYVLDMVPRHVFALLGLGEIARLRNQADTKKEYLLKAKESIAEKSFDWDFYLSELKVDTHKLFAELK
jgi:anaerobic magnesium-protoporphyrin IX monomethyl ester cyclase